MYDLSKTFFIVQETGQPDRVFADSDAAKLAYADPMIGDQKAIIQATVIAKRVRVTVETEQK